MGTAGPGAAWLEGASYLLRSPLALMILAALVLSLHGLSMRNAGARVPLFVACAIGAGFLPPSAAHAYLGPAFLAAVGLALVLGAAPRGLPASVLAAVGGVALGFAAGLQTATGAETFGTLTAAVLLCGAGYVAGQALALTLSTRAIGLGRRVVSAWITAIGMLLLSLQLTSDRPWRTHEGAPRNPVQAVPAPPSKEP